jgi:hypothetical protein
MKERKWKTGFAVVVLLAMGGTAAVAAAGDAEHQELFWPELWQAFHNPTPWLSMGLDHRFRSVWGDNIDTLNGDNRNHEYEYQRYRTRWSTKWALGEDINFNTRLTWEFRTWDEPRGKDVNFDYDEALFDHFNIQIRNLGGMPLTATIGRQDIILGAAWLVLDGTPLDGSRTIFLDAARFTYDWASASTKVDMIYVDNAAESDRWLQPLCDEDRALTEQDERGAILYLTNRSWEPVQLEGFFIYKNDNPIDQTVTNMPPEGLADWSKKAEIYTFGGAVSGTEGENWKYRAEMAYQTGNKEDRSGVERDLDAFGVLTNLEYLFKDSANSSVHVGYEYASGDDPSTSDNEQFDLLWGEWPRWSELYIYTYVPETMVAESTNLHRVNFGHKFNINKQWQLCTDYHALWADETGQPWNPGFQVSSEHRFRGSLITMWAKYKFSSQLYGHLLAEYFCPGDYYPKQNNDGAYFLRFNLEYTF